MADGIEGFLTRKLGPFPVWAYAAGGGLLLGVFLYRKGGSGMDQTAQAAGAPGTSAYAPSPIVITTPQNMAPSQSSINPPPVSSGASVTPGEQARGQVWLHAKPDPNSPVVGFLAPNSSLPAKGASVVGVSWSNGNLKSDQWIPVDYAGGTVYAWAPEVSVSGGGMGGSSVRTLAGSGRVGRFMGRHAHHQWVNTTGMGGKGMALMARKTGVPLIRLQALNPHLRRSPTQYLDGVTRLA